MSYDLYLFPREGRPPLKKKAVLDSFKGDAYKKKGNQVWYENDDTGVYFSFDFVAKRAPDEEGEPLPVPHLSFNLNYFRPHVFGLEAAEVLTPLVKKLDLVVHDGQNEGMGRGDYSEEGFLRGWNAGNRFAHQAMLALQAGGTVHTLPAAANRRYWEWNYHRAGIAEDFFDIDGIDVFTPRISFLKEGDRVRSLCIWPNLVPSAVPAVDYVVVSRDSLPVRFATEGSTTVALVPWAQLRAAASKFAVEGEGEGWGEYLLLDYGRPEDAPAELVDFVHGLPDVNRLPDWITVDQILDEELVREAGAKKPKS